MMATKTSGTVPRETSASREPLESARRAQSGDSAIIESQGQFSASD